MPEIPEMPTRGGADFLDESDRSEEGLEDSEGNGEVRKSGGRIFDEKKV